MRHDGGLELCFQLEDGRLSKADAPQQRLKSHKKSRKGCRNCKLRSIKCDEERPHCARCRAYGTTCDYTLETGGQRLATASEGVFRITKPTRQHASLPKHPDSELLATFRDHVCPTISFGERKILFQTRIIELAEKYAYLRHTILALALMYKRHESSTAEAEIRPATLPALSEPEINHWYLATSGFTEDLESSISVRQITRLDIEHQAALFATSTLLVILSFCYVEAQTYGAAWPFADSNSVSTSADLQWIKLSNGKLSVQSLTSDLKDDPAFHHLVLVKGPNDTVFPPSKLPSPSIDVEYFQHFGGLEWARFTRVAYSSNSIEIVFEFWTFVAGIGPEFESALREKKPRALLILLYWYAKLSTIPLWWLRARTLLEGQAICAHIQGHYQDDVELLHSLHWPSSVLVGNGMV